MRAVIGGISKVPSYFLFIYIIFIYAYVRYVTLGTRKDIDYLCLE